MKKNERSGSAGAGVITRAQRPRLAITTSLDPLLLDALKYRTLQATSPTVSLEWIMRVYEHRYYTPAVVSDHLRWLTISARLQQLAGQLQQTSLRHIVPMYPDGQADGFRSTTSRPNYPLLQLRISSSEDGPSICCHYRVAHLLRN